MDQDLEAKAILYLGFKSKGEKKIADILDKYKINYKYESPVIIQDKDNKQRIWYPDFYLPEYGIHLEYYGMDGDNNYDRSRMDKDTTYKNTGMEIISINPQELYSDIESYIINEIYGIQKKRYSNIQSKLYKLQTMNKSKYK